MNFKKLLMIALFSFGLVNSAFTKETTISPDTLINTSLGFSYYQEQNYEKAFPLLKEGAEGGYELSQLFLAHLYRSGLGTAKNIKKAVHWYKKAAEQGNSDAAVFLGMIYYTGDKGEKKDLKKALYWYQKVKDGEYKEYAQYVVGGAYIFGMGVKQDRKKGIQYLKLSCDNGYNEACDLLRKLTQ